MDKLLWQDLLRSHLARRGVDSVDGSAAALPEQFSHDELRDLRAPGPSVPQLATLPLPRTREHKLLRTEAKARKLHREFTKIPSATEIDNFVDNLEILFGNLVSFAQLRSAANDQSSAAVALLASAALFLSCAELPSPDLQRDSQSAFTEEWAGKNLVLSDDLPGSTSKSNMQPESGAFQMQNTQVASAEYGAKASPFRESFSVQTRLIRTALHGVAARRRLRARLDAVDPQSQGVLTAQQLEEFFCDLIENAAALQDTDLVENESHQVVYVITAVRYTLFILDRLHRERVQIVDLVASKVAEDLVELEGPLAMVSPSNWFAPSVPAGIYKEFLALDKDRNGLLSREEVADLGGGRLSSTFLDALFAVSDLADGQLEFRAYVDLVLAMELRTAPASARYFFNILDIRKEGFLATFALYTFLRDVLRMFAEQYGQHIPVEDVLGEIFDMVNPVQQGRITLRDFVRSGAAATVAAVLTDCTLFYSYETREYQGQEEGDDPAEE